jgi:hypothetical protein
MVFSTFILLLLLPVITVFGTEHYIRATSSHVIRSGAYPNCVNVLSATYFFELLIRGQPLLKLLINIPSPIHTISSVEVVDQLFKPINVEVLVTSDRVTIYFTQPVLSETKLIVLFKGVRTYEREGRVWHYSIYGRTTAIASLVSLGEAHIQTYKSS